MRHIISLFVAIGLICYIELPGLKDKQKTKEMITFVVLLVIGAVLVLVNSIFNVDYSVFTDLLIKIFGGQS